MDRIKNKSIMECDVIPNTPQEVDPLGTVEHCNGLDDNKQSLNPTVLPSAETTASKTRKIVNITPNKSRKMLTIRSSASPHVSHTATVTDSNQPYESVSDYFD